MTMKGLFINIEGHGCVGKTTVIDYVEQQLITLDVPHVVIKNHAHTDFTKALRAVIAEYGGQTNNHALLYTFAAIWTDLNTHVIRPALAENKVVVIDRYTPSTFFFQGELDSELLTSVLSSTDPVITDLSIFLQCDIATIQKRIESRSDVRKDRYNLEFIEQSLQYLEYYNNMTWGYSNNMVEVNTTDLTKETMCLEVMTPILELIQNAKQ